MKIPDPIELIDARIEKQIDSIDTRGEYPCCYCGVRYPIDEMVPASADPSAAPMCYSCLRKDYKGKV